MAEEKKEEVKEEKKKAPEKKFEIEIKAVKCGACSGDLGKATKSVGSGEDAEDVPIARCLSCGKEYDQHTDEYYTIYADKFSASKDNTLLKLGVKGAIDNIEYEIIGRIRYQEEDEWELSAWDEWLGVSADGGYHWFVEEDGEIFDFEEYAPQSINLDLNDGQFEFEGSTYSRKAKGFVSRIVYAEGELSWQPEMGESIQCYDFKKDGFFFTIEQSEDEVSITRGKRIPHKTVIMAFRKDELSEKYDNTIKKRNTYRIKAILYIAAGLVSLGFAIRGCVSGGPIADKIENKNSTVLTDNEYRTEEGGKVYFSQVLYNPVTMGNANDLYGISVSVNTTVQPFNLEWQSYRLMMIKEDKISDFLKVKEKRIEPLKKTRNKPPASKDLKKQAVPDKDKKTDIQPEDPIKELKDALDDIDAFAEPVESFAFNGDFWDEEGYDDEGHWHESDTSGARDFILDDPGRYYLYLELFSQKKRRVDSIKIEIQEAQKSQRYYIILFFVFIGLMIWNIIKSRSYNELPFEMKL
jgi:DNA-directed RNA polymerase subunit N (RpoN/RPB10)